MTKIQVLENVISILNDTTMPDSLRATYVETLNKMIKSLNRPMTEHAKQKAAERNEQQRALNAAARASLVERVAPVLRKYITHEMTAKEIFEAARNELPEDFTANKVQNILLREMAPELEKIEIKNKPNFYRMK